MIDNFSKEDFDKYGINDLARAIKKGFDQIPEQQSEIREEIIKIYDSFQKDFQYGASRTPPLGNFEGSGVDESSLSAKRLEDISNNLVDYSKSKDLENLGKQQMRKIYDCVSTVYIVYSDTKKFYNRASNSIFTNLKT